MQASAGIASRHGDHTIGIILNGATGRICSTQHVANALAPIRDEGGLAGRRRPHRAAADAGRAQRRKARRRRQELRRGMDHRPRQGAGRSGLHGVLRRRRDQPAPGRAGKGHRRRQAHLFREAGGAVGRQGPGAAARDEGARAQARRGRGQARPARLAEAVAARGVGFLRPRDRLPHRVRLVGVRRHRGGRASGRAGTTARRTAAGSSSTCIRTGAT